MPSTNRAVGRNVHLHVASEPDITIGGLEVTKGVTNGNLYSFVEIMCNFSHHYFLRDNAGSQLPKDDHPLVPNHYYIVTDGSVMTTDEAPLFRLISTQSGTRVRGFRDEVRQRDRRCLITGEEAEDSRGSWSGYEAAHIFPLAHEGYWTEHNFGRWTTIPPTKGGSINSVQNGLLLRSDLHQLFDNYDLSINPDDNYKVVVFNKDRKHVGGKYLDAQFLQDPCRATDQLLRWHFRQAVLANMKGAGIPSFEIDFPPGSDLMGDIRDDLMASQRMEFELFSRLEETV